VGNEGGERGDGAIWRSGVVGGWDKVGCGGRQKVVSKSRKWKRRERGGGRREGVGVGGGAG